MATSTGPRMVGSWEAKQHLHVPGQRTPDGLHEFTLCGFWFETIADVRATSTPHTIGFPSETKTACRECADIADHIQNGPKS